jgi:short-subunit dehydrogenase
MHTPRSILITGASSGIGAELARIYAAPGVALALSARDAARLDAVAQECRAKGADVRIASIDVREKEKLAAFIHAADDASPIDLVIANAGISTGSLAGSETMEAAEAVFAVNVDGVINTIHPVIARMRARRAGHIAIMSSLAGIRALPGAPAYSASKAGVRYYGDALRGALRGDNVQVSVICPGWIRTPLTDKNDFPMPFLMPVAHAARIIQRDLHRKKARIAFPKRLYFPLALVAALPHFLTDPLFRALPKK